MTLSIINEQVDVTVIESSLGNETNFPGKSMEFSNTRTAIDIGIDKGVSERISLCRDKGLRNPVETRQFCKKS